MQYFGCVGSNSHVLHSDILEDLAVVDVPDRLVVPHLGRQEDGSEHDALPVSGRDVDLSVGQQPLQVHLRHRDVTEILNIQNYTHLFKTTLVLTCLISLCALCLHPLTE